MEDERQKIISRFDDLKELLDTRRNQALEEGIRSSQAVDKNLILISSGGLALSLTFIEKIGGADPVYIALLVSSWWCLVGTLLCSLASHLAFTESYRAEKILVEAADEHRKNDKSEFDEREKLIENKNDIDGKKLQMILSRAMNVRAGLALTMINFQKITTLLYAVGRILSYVSYLLRQCPSKCVSGFGLLF